MAAILGGLFNSRLQLNLREEKGYTYGVGAGFDMRRGAGPFGVRTAVQTAVTVPAISEALKELHRMRDTLVTDAELAVARDYLVGVFPLRFETPGAVVGAIGGLFVNGLPDDELARYRGLVEAVTAQDVRKAAQDHIHPDRLAIVLVGDADAVGSGSRGGRLRRARGDPRRAAGRGRRRRCSRSGRGGRMIVVIGLPAYAGSADGEGSAGGLAVDVAAAAAARGSSVELVGKVGDDGAGDAVVLALGPSGRRARGAAPGSRAIHAGALRRGRRHGARSRGRGAPTRLAG